VSTNYFSVNGLEPNTVYKYRVQSKNGNSMSDYSETMEQKTLVASTIAKVNANEPLFIVSSNYITIKNVAENAQISVYNLSGTCLFNKTAIVQAETSIPLFTKGIYIVKIQSTKELFSKKIVLF
jgi:hypothetical protein